MITSKQIDYLPPRYPNHALDVRGTIAAWDSKGVSFPGDTLVARLARSPINNLNIDGSVEILRAPSIPHWHPAFHDSIEEGIRPVCLHIAADRGWITYTSCEGHYSTIAGVSSSERHVGILPRDGNEFDEIHAFLRAAIVRYQQFAIGETIPVALMLSLLFDNSGAWPAIDVVFVCKRGLDWPTYFEKLDASTRSLLVAARTLDGPTAATDWSMRS